MEPPSWLPFVALAISLFALFAKWQEKPRLNVFLADRWFSEGGRGNVKWRFVHVTVSNPPAPWWLRWFTYRQPARNTVLHLRYSVPGGTGSKFEYAGRWSGNPEPYQERLVNGQVQQVFDPWLIHMGRFKDMSAGGSLEEVAVAIKIDGDSDCFGFTNESYQGNYFRLPQYRLPTGSYVVTATATSGDFQSDPVRFILHNDGRALTDLWMDVPETRWNSLRRRLRLSAQ